MALLGKIVTSFVLYKTLEFEYAVVDEAQRLRNAEANLTQI